MLLSCSEENSEMTFELVADRYEDDLLEFDEYPKEYFQFFLDLLSENEIYSKRGLWSFFLVVGTESYKLTSEAKATISATLIDNYFLYEDKMLCLTICDFVARNYDYYEAERILLKLKSIEQGKKLKGLADDGLHTLHNGLSRMDRAKL